MDCAALGYFGNILYLPIEIRIVIYKFVIDEFATMKCRSCPRILKFVRVSSPPSYESLWKLEHECLHCFSTWRCKKNSSILNIKCLTTSTS